jgi:hypothetical protein
MSQQGAYRVSCNKPDKCVRTDTTIT